MVIKDLIISLEWGGIVAFMNDHGHFHKKSSLTDKKWLVEFCNALLILTMMVI